MEKRPSNIIVIVLEAGCSHYFQSYGYPLPTTPRLCQLRSQSVTFSNFYATANHTIASALPLFGSTYNDPRSPATVVDHPQFPTPMVSSWLQQQGYKTYFLSAGGTNAWEHYRNLAPAFLTHGWDLARDERHPFWRDSPRPSRFRDNDYLDQALFDDAKRVLHQAKGEKFFLMLWNYETHAPYFHGPGPQDWDERHFPVALANNEEQRQEFRQYLRSLWRVDALIGELYDELDNLGLAEDTLIVVTSDHGEAWGQHGYYVHGMTAYEEEVRVPLILIGPRVAHLGPTQSVLGSHIDVWPTITDVCGLPNDPRWQGRSLFGVQPGEIRRAYFNARDLPLMGVREGKYKYIWDLKQKRQLLFDLDTDPGERRNLAAEYPDLCQQFRSRLRDWTNYQSRLTQERLLTVD
jgi:arylsulfatase A-like enzyme